MEIVLLRQRASAFGCASYTTLVRHFCRTLSMYNYQVAVWRTQCANRLHYLIHTPRSHQMLATTAALGFALATAVRMIHRVARHAASERPTTEMTGIPIVW